MKINNIADITTGLVIARKKAIDSTGVRYKLLTLKSFNSNGYLEKEFLDVFISEDKINEQYLTKIGDIIVRLSSPNTAIYITKELEGILIPSLFVIIRCNSEEIIPEFLQVYLNSERCKRQLAADTIGSAIAIVKTSTFKDLNINKYSIEKQQNIININRLVIEEKKLLNKLLKEKEIYHKTIMRKMLK